jgi:hypothetical protein
LLINDKEDKDDDELEEEDVDDASGVVLSSFLQRISSMFSSLSHSPVFGIHLGRRLGDERGDGEEEGERDKREKNSGEEVHRDWMSDSSSLSRSSPSHRVGDDVDVDVDEEVGPATEGPRRERKSGLGEGIDREGKDTFSAPSLIHFTLLLIAFLFLLFLLSSSDPEPEDGDDKVEDERRG